MRAGAFIATIVLAAALVGCAGNSPDAATVLLFRGRGTSPNDVLAVEDVLKTSKLDYATADSSQLIRMPEAELASYRLLIIPGGNFIEIGQGLTEEATSKVRRAVNGGLNYLGICAGGFLAGNSGPNPFNLTAGVRFGFYGAESQGIRKAAVLIADADGTDFDQYWEDGPQFTGWGMVLAKYPDGTPAAVEGPFGSGWAILIGFHPEAPASWRGGMRFQTSQRYDNAYAEKLIRAALNKQILPHF